MKKYEEYVAEEKKSYRKSKKLIVIIGILIALVIIFQIIRYIVLSKVSSFLLVATAVSIVFLLIAIKNQKPNMRVAKMNKKEEEQIKENKKLKGK